MVRTLEDGDDENMKGEVVIPRVNPHTTIVWDSPMCALDINSLVTKDIVKYPHRSMFDVLKQVDMEPNLLTK
jgi:hypothetical protein